MYICWPEFVRPLGEVLRQGAGGRGVRPALALTAENPRLCGDEITREEEIFVNLVILHLNCLFYARKTGLVFKLEGLRRDVGWFFSLPIPRAVWTKTKLLQNDDFVMFVEACLAGNSRRKLEINS